MGTIEVAVVLGGGWQEQHLVGAWALRCPFSKLTQCHVHMQNLLISIPPIDPPAPVSMLKKGPGMWMLRFELINHNAIITNVKGQYKSPVVRN